MTIRAYVLLKRPHRARIALADGRVMEIPENAVQSVLGYSEWGDEGELVQKTNGSWKFISDSELICDNESQSKELTIYQENKHDRT